MNFIELDCEDGRLRILCGGVESLVYFSKEFVGLITTLAAVVVVVKVYS
jgi:hypothetical protein